MTGAPGDGTRIEVCSETGIVATEGRHRFNVEAAKHSLTAAYLLGKKTPLVLFSFLCPCSSLFWQTPLFNNRGIQPFGIPFLIRSVAGCASSFIS